MTAHSQAPARAVAATARQSRGRTRLRDALNDGSTYLLEVRGDAMSAAEVVEFESEPEHVAAVVLRRADEAAKLHGLEVDSLDAWIPVLVRVT